MLNASDFPPGTIPGYIRADCVTTRVQDVAGRDVTFLGLAPVTIKYKDRRANVTAYYLSNMPVSVILGLDAMGRMDIWVHTGGSAGENIKIRTAPHEWSTVKSFVLIPTVSHARVLSCNVVWQTCFAPVCKFSTDTNLIDDPCMRLYSRLRESALARRQPP